jgi:CMP-2-keto-3-deoxyoctulosonic acid synthetase
MGKFTNKYQNKIKMKKNIIFIPARYRSKRFPGKLLKKIDSKTILEHMSDKVKNINFEPIVVTGDKEIVSMTKKKNIRSIKSKKKTY